ncbi:MAG: M20/M25/M40 family metallo-hydrolase [Gemmatimonadales bacterium]
MTRTLGRGVIVAAALIQAGGSVEAQTLSKTERQIVSSVDAHMADARTLLERVVNINSGTMNFAGVRAVGDMFRSELDALGFTTRWIDGAPFNRAGHLVAERGKQGPKVVLIGHLDTVFEPESPFQKLTWIGDTAATGPGALDMKGGDVVMLQSLKALAAAGVLDRLRITVVLDGDEELTGEPQELARQALRDAAQGADAALGFEDADGDPRHIVIARRGTSGWTLKAKGTPAHSSQIFQEEVGDGAIFEIARILDGWRTRLAGEEFLTFNPGVALGGTLVSYDADHSGGSAFGKDNVIAEWATATGDLRTISVGQREQAKVAMQAVVDDSLPHTSATLTFEDGYPPMAPTEGNKQLLALYDSVSQDLGFGPVSAVDPRRAGAADVSFIADLVPMIIDGLGMKGHGDHTVDEYADMTTFPMQIKRAAVVLSRLAEQ